MSAQITNQEIGDRGFAPDRRGIKMQWRIAVEKLREYLVPSALGKRCYKLLAGRENLVERHGSRPRRAAGPVVIVNIIGSDLLQKVYHAGNESRKNGECGYKHTENVSLANGHQRSLTGKELEALVCLAGDCLSNIQGNEDEAAVPGIDKLPDIQTMLHGKFAIQESEDKGPDSFLNQKEQDFMQKLETVLDLHHADPEFGLQALADEMHVCPRQLQRKLKHMTGYNPTEFLRSYRLKQARELLRTGTQVGLVADTVGFSSPAYFTSCFKAQFGHTPSDYQQRFH
jgi:AraC-like DNA-binding protein